MIYAQVLNCVVQNVIELEDDCLIHLFEKGFDHCVRVDHLSPQPAIGWFHDGEKFMKLICQEISGGLPASVPHGDQTSFQPFSFSDSSGNHEVSLDGPVLKIGCHRYDYVWTRYALFMLIEQGQSRIGPLIRTKAGVSYGRYFDIVLPDVMRLYTSLCTLK